jgi:hypothetical protein
MGNGANNARTKTVQAKSEQDQAAAMALPNASAAQLASFNAKDKFELVKFDKGTSAKDSGFTFKQNGVTFGAGTFESQYDKVSQFDPNKAYTIGGKGDTPTVTQGGLSFSIPNPVALTSPVDAGTISPNASEAAKTTLSRVPRNIKTGTIDTNASARAVSGSTFNKSRAVAIKRPLLSGY